MPIPQHDPPSIGRANRGPSRRANITGAPLAAPTRTRHWRIARACADIHFMMVYRSRCRHRTRMSSPLRRRIAEKYHPSPLYSVKDLRLRNETTGGRTVRLSGDAAVRDSSHVASSRSLDLIGCKSGSPSGRINKASPLSRWIPPQLCQLVEIAPSGSQWLHEIKLDGFRMSDQGAPCFARLCDGDQKQSRLQGGGA